MKSFITVIGVGVFLTAIASVFYGGYLALGYVWNLFEAIDATLRLILLSSFAVFLLGSFIIAGALKSAAQIKLKAQLTDAKIDFYKSVVELYGEYFTGLKTGARISQPDIVGKLEQMDRGFSLVAGSSVIESHRKLEQSIKALEGDELQIQRYQQLIRKMRHDLGHTPNLDETRLKFLVSGQSTTKPGATKEVSA